MEKSFFFLMLLRQPFPAQNYSIDFDCFDTHFIPTGNHRNKYFMDNRNFNSLIQDIPEMKQNHVTNCFFKHCFPSFIFSSFHSDTVISVTIKIIIFYMMISQLNGKNHPLLLHKSMFCHLFYKIFKAIRIDLHFPLENSNF